MKLSQILLHSMLERKESRGAHYREDYPYEDPTFKKRLFVSESQTGTIQFTFVNQ
ncbi:MAG TPA: hypothetical protein VIR64_10875 [Pseudobacillus sp.]